MFCISEISLLTLKFLEDFTWELFIFDIQSQKNLKAVALKNCLITLSFLEQCD